MATIELRNVEKKFGSFHAVKPLNLTINSGEFVVLLGPSGCGKTTTLRMISGLETVTDGNILFDGDDVTWRHPGERNSAFVFQFFALYSHLSARQNIAFPLEAEIDRQLKSQAWFGDKLVFLDSVLNSVRVQWTRWAERARIRQQVQEVAQLLRIEHLLDKRPSSLSGGDQQRIALARALVRRPSVFLMDEPLGALDAEFRETMRAEIKRLHLEQHATTVYVTHDQIEAMAMGDRIVVMSNAVVQQVGTPAEVYHNPSNLFVARFIGSPGMNLIQGRYRDGKVYLQGEQSFTIPDEWNAVLSHNLDSDGKVVVGFRPEAVQVSEQGDLGAAVYADDLHGGFTMLHLEIQDGEIIHARTGREVDYPIGKPVRFSIDPKMIRFFHPQTEMALRGVS